MKVNYELYEGVGIHLNGRHSWCLNNSISLSVRFSIKDEAMDVARFACGRYLLASFVGNKEGNKGLMVLWVKPTPTRFPTNSLYSPMDNAHSLPEFH